MLVFARKTLTILDWPALQSRVEQLQAAMGPRFEFMMFSATGPDIDKQEIYIGLPSAFLLANFVGFQTIGRDQLPDGLTSLVIQEDGFADRYPDIEKKRSQR